MTSIYNELKIDSRLSTSGVIPAECFSELAEAGFEVVINLLPDSSDYAVAGEGASFRELGISYVYIPVDFQAPSRSDFDAFTEAMDASESQKTWVHCAANYRVSAFTSLYMQRMGQMNSEEADALIAKMWTPDEVWSAFISMIRSSIREDQEA